LSKGGQTNNFVTFRPQKNALRLEIRMKRSDEIENMISEKGLDLMDYSKKGRYRIRLSKSDLNKNTEFINELLKTAYSEAME
jgi:predicted transport protein